MNILNEQVLQQQESNRKCPLCEMKKHRKDYEKILQTIESWEKDVSKLEANKESPNAAIIDFFDEYDELRKQSDITKSNITADARKLGINCNMDNEEIVVYPRISRAIFEFHFTSCIKKKKGTQDEMAENIDGALFNYSEAIKFNSIQIRDYKSSTIDKDIRKTISFGHNLSRILNELKRVQNSNNLSIATKNDI